MIYCIMFNMNYKVINFHNIFNVKIVWGRKGELMELSITDEKCTNNDIYPLNVVKVINILDKYYSNCLMYNIEDFLPMEEFSIFYRRVYMILSKIPRGDTVTYSKLAEMAGFPGAHRAVGTAMAKNRYLLLIPCHRVVGVNGIGGFSYGIDIKKRLLELEKK